ncbi:hypothetical protein HAX54_001763, partial [Datura stramonium]|nr:hypothetical protein [Datura stramonium]
NNGERGTNHPCINEVEVGTTTHIAPEKGSANKKKNLDHDIIPGENLTENTTIMERGKDKDTSRGSDNKMEGVSMGGGENESQHREEVNDDQDFTIM